MSKMKLASLLGASVVGVALSQTAGAAVITFDPDGAGPLAPIQAASFDLLPGNSLNQGVLASPNGHFTNLFQARLGSFLDQNGNVIPVPGLNDPNSPNHFEITIVSQFDLDITGLFPGPVTTTTSALSPLQRQNFLRFYYDSNVNASDLAGTGFTDGTMILDGTATFVGGSFSEFSFLPPAPFDQFGTNNYPGVTSNTGIGGTTVDAAVSFTDNNFFTASPAVISLNASTTNSEPFSQANPSHQFFGSIPANIGAVNGVSGPDIQLQTDAVASFVVVPEPGSVMFLTLGALAMGIRRRRHA